MKQAYDRMYGRTYCTESTADGTGLHVYSDDETTYVRNYYYRKTCDRNETGDRPDRFIISTNDFRMESLGLPYTAPVEVTLFGDKCDGENTTNHGNEESTLDPYVEAESVLQTYIDSNASISTPIGKLLSSKIDPRVLSKINVSLGPGRAFHSQPLDWKQLKDIVNKKEFYSLTRSIDDEKVYFLYKEHVKRTWKSLYHHVLHHKFQLDKKRIHESMDRRWEVVVQNINQENHTQIRLLPNDFPYFLSNKIEHWCLWKLKENVTDDDVNVAKEQLVSMTSSSHGTIIDFISWINPTYLKSVPDIDHAHILVLRE